MRAGRTCTCASLPGTFLAPGAYHPPTGCDADNTFPGRRSHLEPDLYPVGASVERDSPRLRAARASAPSTSRRPRRSARRALRAASPADGCDVADLWMTSMVSIPVASSEVSGVDGRSGGRVLSVACIAVPCSAYMISDFGDKCPVRCAWAAVAHLLFVKEDAKGHPVRLVEAEDSVGGRSLNDLGSGQ